MYKSRFTSLAEVEEAMGTESYNKWNKKYEERIQARSGWQRGFQHREELVDAIKCAVKPKDLSYFKRKLRVADTPYSELILKSLQKGKVDTD
jgi:hypothetical protein